MPTILLLGATSEIALALAERFAREKAHLVLAARNVERLQPVKSDLHIRFGVSVEILSFDASIPETHEAFYKGLQHPPDVVICVFGYLGDHKKAIDDWRECSAILNINYTGAVSILNIVASDFERRRKGVIVGVSSVAGDRGRQSNYLYGSAKAGFTAYLSGLRGRLVRSNVHVLTVKPGFVRTKMLDGIRTPSILTASPADAARDIHKAIMKKKDVIYTLSRWRWVMLVIRNIPERVFKKMKL